MIVGPRFPMIASIRWASGKEELYDLTHDPSEQRDLADNQTLLPPLRTAYRRLEGGAAFAPQPQGPPLFDARTRAAMHTLGYLQ